MDELHELRATAGSKASLESVDPRFVRDGLIAARGKTVDALHAIRSSIEEGMTEDDARRLSMELFSRRGVSKHWHKPNVRFGPGTALTFHEPLQPEYRLRRGDPFYIDVGPVWRDPESGVEYEGDFGDTFVLGSNPEGERCAAAARDLFSEARREWRDRGLTGEGVYAFLAGRASELGYRLVERVDGHRLSDFPHKKYSKERLARIPFHPSASLWVLEVQIRHPVLELGAFFEDLLLP